jgi:hypothetical protein
LHHNRVVCLDNSQTRLPERFGPILGRAMREMVNSYAKGVGVLYTEHAKGVAVA